MLLVMGFQHLALLSSDKQLSEELNWVAPQVLRKCSASAPQGEQQLYT